MHVAVADRIALLLTSLALLLPAITAPFADIGFVEQKGILAAFGVGMACIAVGILFTVSRASQEFSLSPFAYIGIPLFLVGCVSALSAGSPIAGWWGAGFELGTVGSLALFALFIALASIVPSRYLQPSLLCLSFGTAGALFHALWVLMFGDMGTGDFTLVGKWPHLSFLLAGALLTSVLIGDAREHFFSRLSFAASSLFFAAGFLMFFQLTAAFIALVILAVLLFSAWRWEETPRFPLLTLCAALFLLISVAVGIRIPVLAVPADFRPSLLMTELILAPSYTAHPANGLIGTGPRTFSAIWDRYRPVELNNTAFWDASFEEAYSSAATLAITLGFLGLAASFLCPVIIFGYVIRKAHLSAGMSLPFELRLSLSLALFFFLVFAFYTIDLTLFLIGAVMLGFCARALAPSLYTVRVPAGIGRLCVVATLLLLGIALIAVSMFQWSAASRYTQGTRLFEEGDIHGATVRLGQAADRWPLARYMRSAASAEMEAAFLAAKEGAGVEAVRARVARSLGFSDRSIVSAPHEYETWIARAALYLELVLAGFVDTNDEVRAALEQARHLAPTRPEPYYLLAILEEQIGDRAAAVLAVTNALNLKPDYVPAQQLLERFGQ